MIAENHQIRALFGHPSHGSREASQTIDDDVKGHASQDHEDQRLKRISPSRAAQSAVCDIGHYHRTDHQPSDPLGDLTAGYFIQCDASRHDADQQVGDDQGNQNHEQKQTEAVRLPPVTKILDLGQITVAFSQRPNAWPHQKKDKRNDQGCCRRHKAEDADPQVISLSGSPEQGERGHVGSKQGHEQEEGPDGSRRHEVILTRPSEHTMTESANRQHDCHIDSDHRYGHLSLASSPSLSSSVGQTYLTSNTITPADVRQYKTW